MAKIAVRVAGQETTMSLGRAREAVANGTATYVRAPKAKKKATKKAAKKTDAKAVARTQNRSMRGRTATK